MEITSGAEINASDESAPINPAERISRAPSKKRGPARWEIGPDGVPMVQGFYTIPQDLADAIDALPPEARYVAIKGVWSGYSAGRRAAAAPVPSWRKRKTRIEALRALAAEKFPGLEGRTLSNEVQNYLFRHEAFAREIGAYDISYSTIRRAVE
ncbi:hypothetical protein WOC76_04400 [Methylocystis sp. IM3]|uniref:hypothetical protein n=1 Tax=unclassified Methylocystis TaxID=2625913 RepID=UPI0030F5E07E